MNIMDNFEINCVDTGTGYGHMYYANNVAVLLAYAREMHAMLKSKEWCMGFVAKMCPECGLFKSQGHSKNCALNALLTKETP